MITGLYTSASGMMNEMLRQRVSSENIANANLPGFKKSSVISQTFPKEFANMIQDSERGQRAINPVRNGVLASDVVELFEEGQMKYTGHNLDTAIHGDGFFVIDTPEGTAYTRNGAFTINGNSELVTMAGAKVMGEGGPILLPLENGDEIKIDQGGNILVGEDVIDRLKVVNFENPKDLKKSGAGIFTAPNGAAEIPVAEATVEQGYLEMPNTNIVSEMTELIEIHRTYNLNATMISEQSDTISQAIKMGGQ